MATINSFPDLNIPELEKTPQWCMSWLDAIDAYYKGPDNQSRKDRINRNYNSHNGTLRKATIELMQKKYGKALSTDFKDYFIGRTKISSLVGEYLEMPLVANVFTTNRESVIKKLENFKILYGAIAARKEIDDVQQKTGWPVMNNMKVPEVSESATTNDIKSLAAQLNPKTMNEVIMQTILNDKIRRGKMKMLLIESLKDLLLTSEIHGKVDIDMDGKDYFRPIPAAYAIFEENLFDYNCSRSIFRGEYRPLYEHEILQMFDLSPTEKIRLKSECGNGQYETNNNMFIVPVIYAEIKTSRPVYTKTSYSKDLSKKYINDIDPLDYESNQRQINHDIENKRYTIKVEYKEDIWEGVKIGQTIYKNMKRKERQIQIKGTGKYHRAKSDYISYLVGTVNGVRIAVQEVITNLAEVYNVLMFQILREIKKNKGKVFKYDEAAMPTSSKNITNVLYDLEEHSVIRFNSAEGQNISDKDINQAAHLIEALDLGLSASFSTMLETKREIERTIDRLTGISEGREGFGKATETATATSARMEGSRSVTGELFYSFNEFVNEMLIILAEKTKLNADYLENEGKYILGDDQKSFMLNTKSIAFDEYGVYMSNGKKENDVKAMLRQYFPAEINASKLRTADVAKFELSDSISEGLAILDRAYAIIQEAENSASEAKNANDSKMAEAALAQKEKDTDKLYQHEEDLVRLKAGLDKQKETQKVASDQMKNLDNIQSKERIADATLQNQPEVNQ